MSRPVGIVRFGMFDVSAASRELRKQGIRVRLAGQPFAILLILLEQPGEVVSREDMRRRLWPDDTFVDFEHGLNSAVKKLRTALGDSAEHPRYIETLPRVGYRFIAPVHLPADTESIARSPAPPTASAAIETVPKRSAASPRWSLGFGLAAVAVLIVIGISALARQPAAQVLDASRLTHTSRIDLYGRIQTDGTRLFFLERRGHRWDLMQMPASGGTVEPFNLPFPNARIFAISPDKSEMIVGSFTSRRGLLPVWIVPTVGGTPARLGEISARDAVYRPDGSEITFSTADGIYAVGRDGAHPRRIASLSGRIEALAWSPDGRVLRFDRGEPVNDTSEIWEIDAAGGNPHAVLPGWDTVPEQCCGRWSPDGRYYMFVSGNHGGGKNIWAIPARRRFPYFSRPEPILVTSGPLPVPMDEPLPSSSGDRLFVLGSNERTEYMRFDPTTGASTSLLRGTSAAWVSISRDGQSAIYVADGVLWRSRPDGSNRSEIAAAAYHPSSPQLSLDGRHVAFQGTGPDGRTPRAYIVSIDGGAAREIVPHDQASRQPAWSPDATAIVYSVAAGDVGAAPGLYVLDLITHATTKMSGSEGYDKTSWSPDGSSIAAVTADDTTVALFDRRSGHRTELAKGEVLGPAVWSADSKFVYFQDVVEEDEPVRRVNVADRRVERVADFRGLLEGGVQRCGFESMAPDGALVVRLARADQDIYSLKLGLR